MPGTSELPILAWDQAYNRTSRGIDSDGKAKPLRRDVVNVIRTYVDNQTLRGWVKQDTLVAATGLSLSAVKRQIKENVEAGWLRVAEKGHSGGKANVYELTFPDSVISDPITLMVSPVNPKGVHQRPLNGVISDTPTTPRTSPRSSNITTPENRVTSDPVGYDTPSTAWEPTPVVISAESSAGDYPADAGTERSEGPTTKSNSVIDDTITPECTCRKPGGPIDPVCTCGAASVSAAACRCNEPGARLDPFCSCKNGGSPFRFGTILDDYEPPF
jgi:hypothetical protein